MGAGKFEDVEDVEGGKDAGLFFQQRWIGGARAFDLSCSQGLWNLKRDNIMLNM